MSLLPDTNVSSELRKGSRGDPGVNRWGAGRKDGTWLSVLMIGENRRDFELKQRNDEVGARHLDLWLQGLLGSFESRIFPIKDRVGEVWGRLNLLDPGRLVDTLLVATAIVHGLRLVMRNADDVAGTGVPQLIPFGRG